MKNTRIIFYIFCLALSPRLSIGQFCTTLRSNTWEGFVEAMEEAIDYGLAVLCPFKIEGDGCSNVESGFLVKDNTNVIVSCDPFLYGYQTNSECVIDCPGRHFTVDGSSQLTLERFTLSGATNSSIMIEAGGNLKVINSMLME